MKKTLCILAVLLIFLLFGCSRSVETEALRPITDPVGLYGEALDLLTARDTFAIDTVLSKQTVYPDGQAFTETTIQEISVSDTSGISIQQTSYFSDTPLTTQLIHQDGMGYLQLGGITFSQEMTSADFTETYFPSPLPDSALYKQITGTHTHFGSVVAFQEPLSTPHLSLPEGGEMRDIVLCVLIDANKNIQSINYQLSYTLHQATVHEFAYYYYADSNPEQAFHVPDSIISVDDLQYPIMIERASGYLQQKESSVQAKAYKYMHSDATDHTYNKDIDICVDHSNGLPMTTINTSIKLTDHSREDTVTQMEQQEKFTNGIYSVKTDNGTFHEQPGVTADTFSQYISNILLENILLPQHIAGITAVQEADHIRLQLIIRDDFTAFLAEETCKTLYQEPELLQAMLDSCVTTNAFAYLDIDRICGLPQTAYWQYQGRHELENTTYEVHAESGIDYRFK